MAESVMAFKIPVNGVLVEVDNIADVLALTKAIAPKPQHLTPLNPAASFPFPAASKPAPVQQTMVLEDDDQFVGKMPPAYNRTSMKEIEMTLEFLSAVASAGTDGADPNVIMPIVGGEHPLGLGAKLRPVKRTLEKAGFPNPELVYSAERSRVAGVPTVWIAGPRIEDARRKVGELLK